MIFIIIIYFSYCNKRTIIILFLISNIIYFYTSFFLFNKNFIFQFLLFIQEYLFKGKKLYYNFYS
ncbi:hypothetical protein LY90DRAFT_237804 [Neocallimastix californiae]|uniref:Uncharacterized protein n=1 Tax=Neocallimastix californiae TaxID=1754190 RepID=A0A1Y2DRC1_9FUNG|nr:hypothetical protein LY90DRAFT_237804 [Neocallimastix californiae]|eukprot:ORY61821.1 hypothetical protein LY90DRAFT_237804 [Neocallimastix californiae]